MGPLPLTRRGGTRCGGPPLPVTGAVRGCDTVSEPGRNTVTLRPVGVRRPLGGPGVGPVRRPITVTTPRSYTREVRRTVVRETTPPTTPPAPERVAGPPRTRDDVCRPPVFTNGPTILPLVPGHTGVRVTVPEVPFVFVSVLLVQGFRALRSPPAPTPARRLQGVQVGLLATGTPVRGVGGRGVDGWSVGTGPGGDSEIEG